MDPTGYIHWFVNWPQAQEPAKGAFDGITEEQSKQQVLELFRDDQPFISSRLERASFSIHAHFQPKSGIGKPCERDKIRQRVRFIFIGAERLALHLAPTKMRTAIQGKRS